VVEQNPKPNKTVDLSDLEEASPVDLSGLEETATPEAQVAPQTPGAKAFSLTPFQGQEAQRTFNLPTQEPFATLPEPVRSVLGVGAGAVKSAADTGLGVLKLFPGTTDFREPISRIQQSYLQPHPMSSPELAGYEGEKSAEWFYPMGAEAKAEKAGIGLLEKIPGLAEKMGAKGPWWGQTIRTVPRAAAQATSGAVVAGAQGAEPAEAASIGGALGLVFGQAGMLGKQWSDTLKQSARAKFMQAMGVEGKEARARAEKVIDEMMEKAPFFMTRRGMMEWAQRRIEEIGRQKAQAELPIALTWGETISQLRKRAMGEIGGRSNFPNVPGYQGAAPISSEWSKKAMEELDKIVGFADKTPQYRPTIMALVRAGVTPETIVKYFNNPDFKQLGDLTYQAIRRGIVTDAGDIVAPYLDLVHQQKWSGELIASKGGYTTKSKEVWANETLAPLRGIGKAIAESVDEGLPDIGHFNDQLSTALNVVAILDPAMRKNLPQEEGLKVLMGGSGHPAERILKLGMWHTLLTALRGVTNSTGWRTTSAAWQAGLANALRRGDVEKAGRMIFALEGANLPQVKEQGPFKKVTAPPEFDYVEK
jgi:hypothetical protein